MEDDLQTTLDEIEAVIETGVGIPLSGRVLVNVEKVYDLLDELRRKIPDEIRHAQGVLMNREAVFAEARNQAETIIKEAQSYAEKLTRESSVVRRADEKAQEILEDAEREGREIRAGAHEYAGEVLRRLENALDKARVVVREGIEEMQPAQGAADAAAAKDESV